MRPWLLVRYALVVAAAAMVSAACGAATEEQAVDVGASSVEDLVDCPYEGEVLSFSPDGMLTWVDEWYQVDAVVEEIDRDATRLMVAEYGAGERATPIDITVDVHSGQLEGINWAVSLEHEVWIGVGSEFLDGPTSLVTIADIDGELTFLGDCADHGLNTPLRDRLGSDYDRVVRSLLGEVDDDTILSSLGLTSDDPGPALIDGSPRLHPGDVSQDVLDSLHYVTLYFPPAVVEQLPSDSICSRIAAGWGDCFSPSVGWPEGVLLSAPLELDDLSVELWSNDSSGIPEANSASGRAELPLAESYADALRSDRDVLLVVDVSEADGVLSAVISDWEYVDTLLSDEKRAREVVGDQLVDGVLRRMADLQSPASGTVD